MRSSRRKTLKRGRVGESSSDCRTAPRGLEPKPGEVLEERGLERGPRPTSVVVLDAKQDGGARRPPQAPDVDRVRDVAKVEEPVGAGANRVRVTGAATDPGVQRAQASASGLAVATRTRSSRSRASSARVAAISRRYRARSSACGSGPVFAIVTRSRTSRSRWPSRIARRPAACFGGAGRTSELGPLVEQPDDLAVEGVDPAPQPAKLGATRTVIQRSSATRHHRAAGDRLESDVIALRTLADDRLERDVMEEVDRRNDSRVHGSERWTSMNGRWTASSASRSATLVWVSPPALTIATSKSRSVQPVDERALVVRLEEGNLETELGGLGRDPRVDLVERFVAIDLGLAGAEEVQVRTLEDEDARHRDSPRATQKTGRGPLDESGAMSCGRPRHRRSEGPSEGGRRRASCRSRGGPGPPRASRGAARSRDRARSSGAPIRAARNRRRHADLEPDPAGRSQAVRDGLAVEEVAVAPGRFERVTQRMAKIECDAATGRVGLALVADDDLDLGPTGPFDDLRHRARVERVGRAARDRRPVASRSSNSRSSPNAAILTASPSTAPAGVRGASEATRRR